MSAIAKAEQYEQEVLVFSTRHDPGVRALRDWLLARQAEAGARWPSATGEDLTRLQGEAALLARMIRLIERGPTIRPQQPGGITP